jgi:hypothetical protein
VATTRSYVKIVNNFPRVGRQYDHALQRAVGAATQIGAAVARAEAQKRMKTGRMADIQVGTVRKGQRGWNGIFASAPHYAIFHEFGTLGKRRKKLAQPSRRTSTSGGGITPLRFMGKGRTAARAALLPLIQREMRRVR